MFNRAASSAPPSPFPRCASPTRVQRSSKRSAAGAGGRRRAPCWSRSRSSGCRPTPATTCSTSARCSTAALSRARQRRRCDRPAHPADRRRRPAAAGRPPALQLRGGRRRGRMLGVVPKTYLPNYREFYEARQFTPGDSAIARDDRPARPARRAVRHRPAVRSSSNQPLLTLPRRDLRGPLGADPAVVATRRWPARRCCSTCRRRTSRSARPTTATSSSASQSARCLAAYLYSPAGLGRIDHRPGLGRPRR